MPLHPPVRQNDFSFGELSPDFAAGGDKDPVAASLKKGRNIRILNSYGFAQRTGSRWLATGRGLGRVVEAVTSAGDQLLVLLSAGYADFYDTNGNLVQSVSGAPWSADEAVAVSAEVIENVLYIAHNNFWTQALTRGADGVWALSNFTFAAGPGNSVSQPYYRFASQGVLLTPSAVTGTIDVAFSDDVLLPEHVGMRFRYQGKELEIATVVDPQNGTAVVIDELPPTYQITVASGSGFRAGDDVEGKVSQTKGTIASISTNTLTVIITQNFGGFKDVSGSEEDIVGPSTTSKIATASQSSVSPAGSAVWDEQVFSPVHGFPGRVFQRSDRLGFADFPEIPDGLALSVPGGLTDFNLGEGGDGDGIFVRIGNSGGQRIRHCVDSASLIVLTDRRAYYVPETVDSPLSAQTFTFTEITPTGASDAFPVTIEDGVIYAERGGNRVLGLLATGDLAAPWRMQDLSRRSTHLIKNPTSFAMTVGNTQAPERYVFALNEDGSEAVMFYDTQGQPRLGWVPWDSVGAYRSQTSINGIVYSLCERVIGGSTVYLLERFDADAQLDASSAFDDASGYFPLLADTGDFLVDDSGDVLLSDTPALPQLVGQTVYIMQGTQFMGQFVIAAPGVVSGLEGVGPFEAGLHFDMDAVLWTPEPPNDASPLFKRRRIARAAVRTEQTGTYALGLEGQTPQTRPSFDEGDDLGSAPPLRDEVYRVTLSGWMHEPRVQITRPVPSPVKILSAVQEVAS